MNAVIYCRVSSKEQVEGTSLESQELGCREYAARNGLIVVKIFVERGESAKFVDRTQLLELMAFASKREHGIERLLVWKVDRLARNVGDHFNIKAGLLKHGIHVISVTEPIDANPEGRLLETILAGFAQFDNDLRAARTLQGMRRKIQEGIFPWNPPLGYKGAKQPGNKKTEPDQPDQPTFGLLQRAWSEFETGRYTKVEILRLITSCGLRTRAGKRLSKQSLDNIFRDQFYAGIIRDPWSGEEHLGQHLPMVSRETFAKVQKIIAGRSHAVPHKSVRTEFPLRTFVRCASCEFSLTGSFSRGRSSRYPYYHCFNKRCAIPGNYPSGNVHNEFVSFLDVSKPDRKTVDRLREYVYESTAALAGGSRKLNEKRVADIARTKQQQQQLVRMKMEQLITDEEFLAQRSLLASRLVELDAMGAETGMNTEAVLHEIDAICDPLIRLAEWWQETTVECKQRFQHLLLPAGYVFSRVGTAQKGRLFSAFSTYGRSKSNGVPLTGQSWNQLVEEISVFAAIVRESSKHSSSN